MNKRIKMVKFYQAILLDGVTGSLSSFTPDDLVSDATIKKGLKADLKEQGVELVSKVASTLVPWNNIAYIQYNNVEEPVTSKPAKAK